MGVVLDKKNVKPWTGDEQRRHNQTRGIEVRFEDLPSGVQTRRDSEVERNSERQDLVRTMTGTDVV